MTATFDSVSADDLPPRLAQLAELIGLTATLRLVDARGGTVVYVPDVATTEHWLARLLGIEVLAKLVKAYPRDFMHIDRAAGALRAARDRHIVARHRDGQSTASLALDYQLTQRQVFNILARTGTPDDTQPDLFQTATR